MESVGSRLRDARETRGLTLEDVAQITKISRTHLGAIEADNFQVLPAPIFARGFVRSYAGAVGLDPNVLVRALPSSLDVVADTSRRRPEDMAFLASTRESGPGFFGRYSQLLLVMVAVAMFLTAWWMMGANQNSGSKGRQAAGSKGSQIERTVPGTRGFSDATTPTQR